VVKKTDTRIAMAFLVAGVALTARIIRRIART
jgi:hypothetical protein